MSEDLVLEGLARELVNKINTMRREVHLAVSDRIHVVIQTSDSVRKSFEMFGEFISQEVLATKVSFESCEGVVWDLNGEAATIVITKV